MAITDKQMETLISLANSCWTEYDTRRSYEWKVSFGLWTAIGIIAGFALKEDLKFQVNIWILSSVLLLLISLVFVAYIRFQRGLFESNQLDQDKRHVYINEFIHPEVGIDHNKFEKLKKLFEERSKHSNGKYYQNWSHQSQIIITGAFLLILFFIIIGKNIDKDPQFKNSFRHPHHKEYYKGQ